MDFDTLVSILKKKIDLIIKNKDKASMKKIIKILIDNECNVQMKKNGYLFVLDKLPDNVLIKLITIL